MEVIYTRHITLREGVVIAIVGGCVSCDREHERRGGAGRGGVLQIGRLCLFSLDRCPGMRYRAVTPADG